MYFNFIDILLLYGRHVSASLAETCVGLMHEIWNIFHNLNIAFMH